MQPPRESSRCLSDRDQKEFLIFRLWGPMASWGEIAVGERRSSWPRPSRSGVLGLVAAALGIDRADTDAHRRIETELGFAVRVDHPGKPLRDYHTAQSPSQRRGVRWATRRDELRTGNDINTILSERGYYQEMDAVIVLWVRAPELSTHSLTEVAARLAEPVFTLYLGRKSCPLGLPLVPQIVEAASLHAALHQHDQMIADFSGKLGHFAPERSASRKQTTRRELWLGEDDATLLGLEVRQRTQRRDGIRDRARWLFDDRAEVEISEAAHIKWKGRPHR